MSASIQDKDLGMKNILKEIGKLKGSYVKAGVLDSSGNSPDGVSIVQYATWNENGVMSKKGTWKIPPRPFIKGWVDTKKKEINKVIETLNGSVIDGKSDASTALKKLGVFAKSGIQDYIRTGNFTPNKASTIRMKGSSQPLIETGTMRKAINYEVVQ